MIRWLAILCLLPACAFGVGSAYVGQWRPHTDVELQACRVDASGGCSETKTITTFTPAKKFWGVNVTWPGPGASMVTQGGMTEARLRLAPSLEVLEGAGRFAVGLRSGAILDIENHAKGEVAGILPVDVLGHLSLGDRIGIYGGVGYTPYARVHDETSMVGARALGGVQFVLQRDFLERYIVLTVEADTTWVDFDHPYHSTGLTSNLGFFF
jgi:hypothetical protein